VLASLRRRAGQAVKLPEVWSQGLPIPTRTTEASPSVNCGLGVVRSTTSDYEFEVDAVILAGFDYKNRDFGILSETRGDN
jgi:hypothetical protein